MTKRAGKRRVVASVAIGVMSAVLGGCGLTSAIHGAPPGGLVSAINAQRAARGLPLVGSNTGLDDFAGNWAGHLAATGVLEHQDLATVPGWNALGETLEMGACGQPDAAIVTAWMNSPSHNAIVASPAYRLVGVAKVCADGNEYVVADFGG